MSTVINLREAHFYKKVAALEKWARENHSFEEVTRMFAFNKAFADELEYRLKGTSADQRVAIELSRLRLITASGLAPLDSAKAFEKILLEVLDFAAEIEKKREQKKASQRGKAAANDLHGKPGGNRDKQAAIRAIWATGKYKSRDVCAEQECAALNMAFGTARKALRNTPNAA